MTKTNELIEQLADIVREDNRYDEARPCFVSIYRSEQAYGGPEEGGWWHTIRALEGSVPFPSRDEAERYLAKAKEIVEQRNREDAPERHKAMANLPDIETAYHDEGYIPQGWSDGGELSVCIEDRQGESDNTAEGMPHYE